MTSFYPYSTTTSASGVYPSYQSWGSNAAGTSWVNQSYSASTQFQPTGGSINYDDLARERMTDVAARIKRRLERGNG